VKRGAPFFYILSSNAAIIFNSKFLIFNFHHYDQVSISAQKKESGELSILLNDFELPLKYQQWMEIYEYHLEHPKKSQWQVSLAFRVSKGTVWNAYRFMGKELKI